MKKNVIRISLEAYHHAILDRAVQTIISSVERHLGGGVIRGPIPLPTARKDYTVLRSPHVDKKSREKFEIKVHKRILDIVDAPPQMGDTFTKVAVPAGVDIRVEVI